LLTGESFKNVRELKKILATARHQDFYRCLTEKLLTYALGRGLDYYDVEAVDKIVDQLEASHGKFSTLLNGVVESAPFQKRRNIAVMTASGSNGDDSAKDHQNAGEGEKGADQKKVALRN
jgi:hypothetical protein